MVWIDDFPHPSSGAVNAVIGSFEGENAEWEWNTFGQLCSGGIIIKTSSKPCFCTDIIDSLWHGGMMTGDSYESSE